MNTKNPISIFPSETALDSYPYETKEEKKIVRFFFERYRSVQEIIEKSLSPNRRVVEIVSVTKSQPASIVAALCSLSPGLNIGENRVKVAKEKFFAITEARKHFLEKGNLPLHMHFVGRLQTNDVKPMLTTSSTLHSVDRLSLLEILEKRTAAMLENGERKTPFPVYLQVNFSREEQKAGFFETDAIEVLPKLLACRGLRFIGLMAMAPNTKNTSLIEDCFKKTFALSRKLQNLADVEYSKKGERNCEHNFLRLSLGMSGDYRVALRHGSTCVRIGSLLFP